MDGENARIVFLHYHMTRRYMGTEEGVFVSVEIGCVCNETSRCCFLLESAFHLWPPAAQALYVCIHVDKSVAFIQRDRGWY